MSREEASSSGAGSGSGGAAIPYDYSSNISKHERSANHNKPPMFNVLSQNPKLVLKIINFND